MIEKEKQFGLHLHLIWQYENICAWKCSRKLDKLCYPCIPSIGRSIKKHNAKIINERKEYRQPSCCEKRQPKCSEKSSCTLEEK